MPDALPPLSPAELARYSRHILLGEIGVAGQQKLAAARVLVVGAGGLGSPAALYLAAAGIGTLGIADMDRVELHNLHRQLVHADADVGRPKVESAAQRLRTTNPHITVNLHPEGITAENAVELFRGYDVIVDGTDNFSTRYLNNDAAFFAGRPLVYGSVFRFDGQVAVFNPAAGHACYRCLFREPPPPGSVPGCGEAGVVGALCGVVGSMQAMEVVKLITGAGKPLQGRLVAFNALEGTFRTLTLPRDPDCPLCGRQPTIRSIDPTRYRTPACADPLPAVTSSSDYPVEISVTEAKQRLDAAPAQTEIVDVREPFELDICHVAGSRHIPMRQIPESAATLPRDKHLLILCHAGGRSRRVTDYLRAQGFDRVTNIAGGIDAWAEQIEPGMRRY